MFKIRRNEKELDVKSCEKEFKQNIAQHAISLSNVRASEREKIATLKAILNPPSNSFNEFLMQNVDDWESRLYPILDDSLLQKELKVKKVSDAFNLGFELDNSELKKIPTRDEAFEKLKFIKKRRSEYLKNSIVLHREKRVKFAEDKAEINYQIELLNSKMSAVEAKIFGLKKEIDELYQIKQEFDLRLDLDIQKIDDCQDEKVNSINKAIKTLQEGFNFESRYIAIQQKRDKAISEAQKRAEDSINKRENRLILWQKDECDKLDIDIDNLSKNLLNSHENELISSLSKEIKLLHVEFDASQKAKYLLEEYEAQKDFILKLPKNISIRDSLKYNLKSRKNLIEKIINILTNSIENLTDKIYLENERIKKFQFGIEAYSDFEDRLSDEKLTSDRYLYELIASHEDVQTNYRNNKSKFRGLIDKLRKLENHGIIDINLNMDDFDKVESLRELKMVCESLKELEEFEKHKYDISKKAIHGKFDSFLTATIPNQLTSFNDLESDFEKAKKAINKNLEKADFGVIKNIRLNTDSSVTNSIGIASLIKQLSAKVAETTTLYSTSSLFFDADSSVQNINDILNILKQIKSKGSNGMLNLFDTVDLSISYVENGKNIQNKYNIKDDSSSGGNILLKVAIAISLLSRFADKTKAETPFFLIIDEVAKLQSKNQELIKQYINDNGFKTLFITPDPAYPDPANAIFYTFKNIKEEGEVLEIRQMSII